jgi:quercetin dioxygenase-like cupin family protein
MRSARLDDMIRGWFIGDFEPTALRTDAVEVAVKHYQTGDTEELHHHRVATELTAVLSGEVRMCGRVWGPGDIIVLDPGEATAFEAISTATVIAVKTPGARGDKYPGSRERK